MSEERLIRIEGKLDVISGTLSDQRELLAVIDTEHKSLYNKLENHTIEKCPNVIRHYDDEHKGLAGHILKVVAICMGIIIPIISLVYWLITTRRG